MQKATEIDDEKFIRKNGHRFPKAPRTKNLLQQQIIVKTFIGVYWESSKFEKEEKFIFRRLENTT